jgi:6-pyruvoyltetrahydropterin/6-carboxytetrahydropterin synthase
MPRVRVTRRLHFSAAHRLYRPDWSDDRNAEVFGDCANPDWHGHNYEIDVTVEGEVDPETGYVMDLKLLRDEVEGGSWTTWTTGTSTGRYPGWRG